MPYLATMPSCQFYIRSPASGSTAIRDWSSFHVAITSAGSIAGSLSSYKYPPASISFNGSSQYFYTPVGNTNFWSGYPGVWMCWFDFTGSLASNTGRQLMGNLTGASSTTIGTLLGVYNNAGTNPVGLLQLNINQSSYPSIIGSTVITAGWHHLAVTKTSGDLWTLYLDGVSQGTTTTSGTIESGGSYMQFGYAANGGFSGYFYGYGDEYACWQGSVVPSITDIWKVGQTRRLIL